MVISDLYNLVWLVVIVLKIVEMHDDQVLRVDVQLGAHQLALLRKGALAALVDFVVNFLKLLFLQLSHWFRY